MNWRLCLKMKKLASDKKLSPRSASKLSQLVGMCIDDGICIGGTWREGRSQRRDDDLIQGVHDQSKRCGTVDQPDGQLADERPAVRFESNIGGLDKNSESMK